MLFWLYRFHLLPYYTCNVASSCIIDVSLQIDRFVLGNAIDEAKAENLNLQESRLALYMAQIVCKVVLVVRTWTICHTQSIVEVLDWVASKARRDDRAIASLTILVAIKASACIYIRILAEGADSSTNHLRHFHIVVYNLVGVLVLGIGRAFRVALAHKKLVCWI